MFSQLPCLGVCATSILWTIRRASSSQTDLYLLAALDLERGPDGEIVRVQGDQAIYLNVLGRTFWISLMVTLACLVLGFRGRSRPDVELTPDERKLTSEDRR